MARKSMCSVLHLIIDSQQKREEHVKILLDRGDIHLEERTIMYDKTEKAALEQKLAGLEATLNQYIQQKMHPRDLAEIAVQISEVQQELKLFDDA